VGNTLDRKLASGDPYSGKLQLWTGVVDTEAAVSRPDVDLLNMLIL